MQGSKFHPEPRKTVQTVVTKQALNYMVLHTVIWRCDLIRRENRDDMLRRRHGVPDVITVRTGEKFKGLFNSKSNDTYIESFRKVTVFTLLASAMRVSTEQSANTLHLVQRRRAHPSQPSVFGNFIQRNLICLLPCANLRIRSNVL